MAERCFHALDHDRLRFNDPTGRCAVASAGTVVLTRRLQTRQVSVNRPDADPARTSFAQPRFEAPLPGSQCDEPYQRLRCHRRRDANRRAACHRGASRARARLAYAYARHGETRRLAGGRGQ
ncbi:hypothetical protein FJV41_04200 [Myxococcus llanfairpwllgwyngyllgogerychwyrndrobwllllantysiliogogogochensis]|uniref:Uncharacterized protein n=1 Tax=Myxococcus llanfairpwllgwyngyllgogerychwyrndrobwllllantysiliogogogochensis TaxID=2590453 RepID=A0A540X7S8_9BACT|nr:hypothetical protein FJV41_04200 [Myxococcus llanfairpwllgwyngyllgogerychwyrndrobwllllantysiliogogogochensis]